MMAETTQIHQYFLCTDALPVFFQLWVRVKCHNSRPASRASLHSARHHDLRPMLTSFCVDVMWCDTATGSMLLHREAVDINWRRARREAVSTRLIQDSSLQVCWAVISTLLACYQSQSKAVKIVQKVKNEREPNPVESNSSKITPQSMLEISRRCCTVSSLLCFSL